jgi:hypothetical protein
MCEVRGKSRIIESVGKVSGKNTKKRTSNNVLPVVYGGRIKSGSSEYKAQQTNGTNVDNP